MKELTETLDRLVALSAKWDRELIEMPFDDDCSLAKHEQLEACLSELLSAINHDGLDK